MNTIFTFITVRRRARWAELGEQQRHLASRDFVSLSMYSATACLLALTVGCTPSPSENSEANTGMGTMTGTNTGSVSGSGTSSMSESSGTTAPGTTTQTTTTSTTDASSGTTGSSTATGDTSASTTEGTDSASDTTSSSGTSSSSTSTGGESTSQSTSSDSESSGSDSESESASEDTSAESSSSSESESESTESTSEDSSDTGDDPTTVTLEHTGRGAFNSRFVVENTGATWKVISGSYQIRHIGGLESQSAPASRDYFSFSLNGVQGTVTIAELHITHPGNSYDSADPTETITLYDISTSKADLETPDVEGDISILEGIFSDLGSGKEYGSFVADASSDDTVEIVPLNAAALADIQTAINNGADWSIGGSLTSPADTLTFGAFERVFRGSDASGGTPQPATKLVLTGDLNR